VQFQQLQLYLAACDNQCSNVFINAHSIGTTLTPAMPSGGFSSFTQYTIPVTSLHYFVVGANHFDFTVHNVFNGHDNPTGLRVEFVSGI